MTTFHTFHTAQGTTITRRSKTRQYVACLVATVTEAALDLVKAEIVRIEKQQAEARAKAEVEVEAEAKEETADYAESLDWFINQQVKKLQGLTVGDQRVVSWHLTLANAEKAIGDPATDGVVKRGRFGGEAQPGEAARWRLMGYRVEISTTFEVRETQKRA